MHKRFYFVLQDFVRHTRTHGLNTYGIGVEKLTDQAALCLASSALLGMSSAQPLPLNLLPSCCATAYLGTKPLPLKETWA